MVYLLNEGDGWRCGACGYFHRADVIHEKPPTHCEDCDAELAPMHLLGKRVHFAHQVGGHVHTVTSVSLDGMVELDDLPGKFASHLFVEIPLSQEPPPQHRP